MDSLATRRMELRYRQSERSTSRIVCGGFRTAAKTSRGHPYIGAALLVADRVQRIHDRCAGWNSATITPSTAPRESFAADSARRRGPRGGTLISEPPYS